MRKCLIWSLPSRNKREEQRIKRIPSLLGRDFINKYSLFLNKKKDVVLIS